MQVPVAGAELGRTILLQHHHTCSGSGTVGVPYDLQLHHLVYFVACPVIIDGVSVVGRHLYKDGPRMFVMSDQTGSL